MKVTVVKSTIKCYHIFRRRPHSAIEMFVNKEFGNPKDSDAMTVDMPVLENIQKSHHNDITRHEKGKKQVNMLKILQEKLSEEFRQMLARPLGS